MTQCQDASMHAKCWVFGHLPIERRHRIFERWSMCLMSTQCICDLQWFTYIWYKYYDIFTYACDTCEWSYLMCFICITICMAVLYSWIYSWVSQTNSNSHSGINAVIATLPTAVIPQFPRQNGHGVNPNSVQCDEVAGCRGLWVWVRFVVDCWEQATLGTWRFVRWYCYVLSLKLT